MTSAACLAACTPSTFPAAAQGTLVIPATWNGLAPGDYPAELASDAQGGFRLTLLSSRQALFTARATSLRHAFTLVKNPNEPSNPDSKDAFTGTTDTGLAVRGLATTKYALHWKTQETSQGPLEYSTNAWLTRVVLEISDAQGPVAGFRSDDTYVDW